LQPISPSCWSYCARAFAQGQKRRLRPVACHLCFPCRTGDRKIGTVNPEGSVDPAHPESAEAVIASCLVLRQVPCLRWRSALVPRAKRSESYNRKYAWHVSPPRGSLANSDPIVNIPHCLKTAMPARRFPTPWSVVISHLFELAWVFFPSMRRVRTQVPPVAGAAMVANESPDGGQRR